MTIHDRLPNEHFVETRHTYYARCSCGWMSPTLRSEAEADAYSWLHTKMQHPSLTERAPRGPA